MSNTEDEKQADSNHAENFFSRHSLGSPLCLAGTRSDTQTKTPLTEH
jgi:hypothetical protein